MRTAVASPSAQPVLLVAVTTAMLASSFAQQSVSKAAMTIKVDHASVCGAELEPMRQGFAAVGLSTDYGGPHANGVTHMALLGFDDGSYLELIAPQKPGAVEGTPWAKLMAGDAGACAWAVGTEDIKQEVERLKGLRIPTEGPKPGSRKRPDGMAIEWITAAAGAGPPGSTLPFLIEDRTPRAWRAQPSASVKDSGLIGIEAVVLAVNDLNAAIALLRQAYGWAEPLVEPHADFAAKLAYFPGQPVILASPSDNRSWLGERLQRFGESPVAYLIGTRDFGSAMKRFHLSGTKTWFGQKVTWFDPEKVRGIRLGVLGP